MAITSYLESGKKVFEVYVNGFDSRGMRIQRRRRGIESLRKAEGIEFELMRELAKLREEAVPLKWEEWFDECMKRMRLELMPSTIASYTTQVTKWIHPHWTGKEIRTISKSDVYDVIFTKCNSFKTDRTRRNVLKMVKRIFQLAFEDGLVERNPCTGVNVKVAEVQQKVLTNSEVMTFLEEAERANHRFFPVWSMALFTGMRSGELYALKWSDIDFDSEIISVSRSWNSKNGITGTKSRRTRVVPINEELMPFLKAQKLKGGSVDDHVLPRLGEWEHGEQAMVTRDFCRVIGVTEIKFHDLRATFITNLLSRGESLATVMSIVGHSDLKTTNCYLRKAGVDVKGGTSKLGYHFPVKSKGTVLSIVNKVK